MKGFYTKITDDILLKTKNALLISVTANINNKLYKSYLSCLVDIEQEIYKRGYRDKLQLSLDVNQTGEIINPPYARLFWLEPDYSDIRAIRGVIKLEPEDIINKKEIDPIGYHYSYEVIEGVDHNLPRGRVVLAKEGIQIFLGDQCLTNVPELIKEEFGLNSLVKTLKEKHNIILLIGVKWHFHWNPGGNLTLEQKAKAESQ